LDRFLGPESNSVSNRDSFPVAVLSFNLEDGQETTLCSRGVVVSRRFDTSVVSLLPGIPPGGAGTVLPAV